MNFSKALFSLLITLGVHAVWNPSSVATDMNSKVNHSSVEFGLRYTISK